MLARRSHSRLAVKAEAEAVEESVIAVPSRHAGGRGGGEVVSAQALGLHMSVAALWAMQ